MLMQLRMLKLSVEKGRQVIKQLCPSCNIAEYCRARGVCALQSSSYLEFSSDEVRDVSRENSSQEMCRVSLLDAWHKREGREATFLKLARAFHRRKRRDLVDLLCTKLKSTLTLIPLSGNVTSLDMPSGNDKQLQVQHFQNGSVSTGTDIHDLQTT